MKHPITSSFILRSVLSLMLMAALILQSSCAIFNSDNTPVFNKFEDTFVPESDGWMMATFPVTFPMGLIAITIDQFLVRPFQIADDTYKDVKFVCWSAMNWDENYVDQCFYIPWRIVGSVIFAPLNYFGRLFFDIPSHDSIMDEAGIPRSPDSSDPAELERERLQLQRQRLEDAIKFSQSEIERSEKHLEEVKAQVEATQADLEFREEQLRAFDAENPEYAPKIKIEDVP